MSDGIDGLRALLKEEEHDKCEFCLGIKGGALGNENVVNGIIVCDYCHVLIIQVRDTKLKIDLVQERDE